MPAARLLLFAALLLAGCDVFQSGGSPIPFRLVADTTVSLPDSVDLRYGGGLRLLRSQGEADASRAEYGLPGALPGVDWASESLFIVLKRIPNNQKLVVTLVEIYGNERVEYTYEQQLSQAPATGLHTVLVAVATEHIAESYGWSASESTPPLRR